jgi:hypothetical protein
MTTYSYSAALSSSNNADKKAAQWLSTLFDSLSAAERDTVWTAVKSSDSLWALITNASESPVVPQNGPLDDAYGYTSRNSITIDLNKVRSSSIENLALVLAHELIHFHGAMSEYGDLKDIALAAGSSADSYARAKLLNEAKAYQKSWVVRNELVSAGVRPANLASSEAYQPEPNQNALDSLLNQLVARGDYRRRADNEYFAFRMGLPIAVVRANGFDACMNVQKTADDKYTASFTAGGQTWAMTFQWNGQSMTSSEMVHFNGNIKTNETNLQAVEGLLTAAGGLITRSYQGVIKAERSVDGTALDELDSLISFNSYNFDEEGYYEYEWADDEFWYVMAGQALEATIGLQGDNRIAYLNEASSNVHLDHSWLGQATSIRFDSDGDVVLSGGAGDTYLRNWGNATLVLADGSEHTLQSLANQNFDTFVFGSSGSDEIVAESSASIAGGAGDDEITGSNGDDVIAGNEGDDFIDGREGLNTLYGGSGNDILYTDGGGTLSGGEGSDFISSFGSNGLLAGDAGDDELYAGGTNNELVGGDGNDFLLLAGSGGTATGGAGDDYLYNEGSGSVMSGGTGTDFLEDWSGSAVINWSDGSGYDYVGTASEGTTVKLSTSGAVTAKRLGQNLVLDTGAGGVTFTNWFTGQSRATIELPNGTRWSPGDIDASFSDGAYEIQYATGVVPIENALSVLLSYVPNLDSIGLPGYNRTTWEWNASTLQGALDSSMYGTPHTDVSGARYYSWSAPFRTDVFTDGISVTTTTGTYAGGGFARLQGSLSWDYWTDSSGQAYIAVTSAASSITRGVQYVVPPHDGYDWSVGSETSAWWSGPSASAVRQVTEFEPRVDSFLLYQPGSPLARAFNAALTSYMEVAETPAPMMTETAFEAGPAWALPSDEALESWLKAADRFGVSLNSTPSGSSQSADSTGPWMQGSEERRVTIGYLPVQDMVLPPGPNSLEWLTRNAGSASLDRTRIYTGAGGGASSDFSLTSMSI